MRRIRRRGEYFRIADPAWIDPLDPSHSVERGGRWNPPGPFPVLYLNRDLRTSRANLERRFAGFPYGPETLRPEEAPVLVQMTVEEAEFVDVVTEEGCVVAGLPATYPLDHNGQEIGWDRCQPIGLEAWHAGEAGIACRSAATPDRSGEELAMFGRARQVPLRVERRFSFQEWFW